MCSVPEGWMPVRVRMKDVRTPKSRRWNPAYSESTETDSVPQAPHKRSVQLELVFRVGSSCHLSLGAWHLALVTSVAKQPPGLNPAVESISLPRAREQWSRPARGR